MADTATGPGWELRQGDWREVLNDVTSCDAVITDPPYSARTHAGHDDGVGQAGKRRKLGYTPMEAGAVWLSKWAQRASGWFVAFTSHDLVSFYEKELALAGRYVFAPLPWVAPGSRVRLCGDGPSCWTTQIVVARPRTQAMAKWGTLPGAYIGPAERCALVVGAKPLWLMRALIRDYTRPGDLVVDPYAGGATTLLAAVIEGRRAIGAELDPETYAAAVGRMQSFEAAQQVELLPRLSGEQGEL